MMIDPNVALALLGCLGSTSAMLFYSGRQVGKVEAAVGRLSIIESALKDIPVLKTDVEILKSMYAQTRSDFKALRAAAGQPGSKRSS